MIQVNKLAIGYRTKQKRKVVFENINLQLNKGQLIGVVGDNGVGKSTFLKTITGTISALAGDILVNQKHIKELSAQDLSKLISIVTTEKIGGFNLTVFDVVASGRIPYLNFLGKLSDTDLLVVEESLLHLNLTHLKNSFIDELSDGQRQKVMIAKSLAQKAPIIVLDEPTAFLDYNSKHQLFQLLRVLAENDDKLILVSSHDLDLMNKYIHKTIEFNNDYSFVIR